MVLYFFRFDKIFVKELMYQIISTIYFLVMMVYMYKTTIRLFAMCIFKSKTMIMLIDFARLLSHRVHIYNI